MAARRRPLTSLRLLRLQATPSIRVHPQVNTTRARSSTHFGHRMAVPKVLIIKFQTTLDRIVPDSIPEISIAVIILEHRF